MKEKEKKQSKQHIQSLAELCIYEIYENKFLIIFCIYSEQIKIFFLQKISGFFYSIKFQKKYFSKISNILI